MKIKALALIAVVSGCTTKVINEPAPSSASGAATDVSSSAPAVTPPAAAVSPPAAPDAPSAPSQPTPPAPPPPSVTFGTGTLDELVAYSPSLTFDTLEISGKLSLPPNGFVEIIANTVIIDADGSIVPAWNGCALPDAPALTITANESITVNGAINLQGRYGQDGTEDSDCLSSGGNGGALSMTADTITIAGPVTTNGGGGAHTSMPDGPGKIIMIGGEGGSAGDITFTATSSVTITGRLLAVGGAGGEGGGGIGIGTQYAANGSDGVLTWDAPHIVMKEPNDENATVSAATPVPLMPLTITGAVSTSDDSATASDSDSLYYTPQGGVRDRLEDLYRTANTTSATQTVTLNLSALSQNDLDLVLIAEVNGELHPVAASVGPTASEHIQFVAQPNTTYVIAVSALTSSTTSYTLTVQTST